MSQYRVYEGTNENKRQGNKNAKKYHEFLHHVRSFDFSN